MIRLQGVSPGNTRRVAREVDFELRGDQVSIYVHPPNNEQDGQQILVSRAEFEQAVQEMTQVALQEF